MFARKSKLPRSGLIISCYLESMHGAEKTFISAVANLSNIVALRVEGIENISYAKSISNLPIVGLIKRKQNDGSYITASVEDLRSVENAGADIVAIDSRLCNKSVFAIYQVASLPIMADIETPSEGAQAFKLGAAIIATTFKPKAFDLLRILRSAFPQAPINLEGGIERPEEIKMAFEQGARYVTIGKMINDPPTIIRHFLNGSVNYERFANPSYTEM